MINLIKTIYQNLDIYLAIILAIIISILGVLGVVDQSIIASAILGTLGLIAYGLVKNRNQDEQIKKRLLELNTSEKLSEKFFTHEFSAYELKEQLTNAHEAIFWGLNFSQTVQVLTESIFKALNNNCNIRFLIIEHESSAIEMAAFRNSMKRTPEKANKLSKETLTRLAEISNQIPQGKGKLKVRVINYLPAWTTICINPNKPDGLMSIRLTTFRISNDQRPHFKLRALEDNHWFSFFLNQFESAWNEGKDIDIKKYLNDV